MTTDDLCPLCSAATECDKHLFFECPFSQRCIDSIESWTGIRFKYIKKMDFWKYKLKKVQQQIMKAIYASNSVCNLEHQEPRCLGRNG